MLFHAARFFDRQWTDEGFSNKKYAAVQGHDFEVPSTFILMLRETQWLSTGEGAELCTPSALWGRNTAVRQLFEGLHNHVAYVHGGLTNETFLEDVGVQLIPSVPSVLQELRRWSRDPSFRALPIEMSKVYAFLSNQFQANASLKLIPTHVRNRALIPGTMRLVDHEYEIKRNFEEHKLVFLPHKSSTLPNIDEKSAREGYFCGLSTLRFEDKTRTIECQPDSPIRILAPYYTRGFDGKRCVSIHILLFETID